MTTFLMIFTIASIVILSFLLIRLFARNYNKSKLILKAVFNDVKNNLLSFTMLVLLFAIIVGLISGSMTGLETQATSLEEYLIQSNAPTLVIESLNYNSEQVYNDLENMDDIATDPNYSESSLSSISSDLAAEDPFLNTSTLGDIDTSYPGISWDAGTNQTADGINNLISALTYYQSSVENNFIFNFIVSAEFTIDLTGTIVEEQGLTEASMTLIRAPQSSTYKSSYSNDADGIDVPFIGDVYDMEGVSSEGGYLNNINDSKYDDQVFIFGNSQIIPADNFYQPGVSEIKLSSKGWDSTPSEQSLEVAQTDLHSSSNIYPALTLYNDSYLVGFVNYDTFNNLYQDLSGLYIPSYTENSESIDGTTYVTIENPFNWSINIGFKDSYANLHKNGSYEDYNDVTSVYSDFFDELVKMGINTDSFVWSGDSQSAIGSYQDYVVGYDLYDFTYQYYSVMNIFMFAIFLLVGIYIIGVIIKGIANKNQKNLGMLKSFGFKTEEISFAYSQYPLIALLIGGVIGIGVSFLIAGTWTSLLGLYATIPTAAVSYSLWNFLFSFILPILAFTYFSYRKITKTLNKNSLDLIGEKSYEPNRMTRFISKIGKGWKFDTSYAFTNLVKSTSKALFIFMSIFSVSFMLLISFMMVGMTGSESIFGLTDDVVNTLNSVMAIFMIISVVFGLILMAILMTDLSISVARESAVMKALGINDKRITFITFGGFILIFIVSLALIIPISYGLIAAMNALLGASTSSSFVIQFWQVAATILIVAAQAVIVGVTMYYRTSKVSAVEALEER